MGWGRAGPARGSGLGLDGKPMGGGLSGGGAKTDHVRWGHVRQGHGLRRRTVTDRPRLRQQQQPAAVVARAVAGWLTARRFGLGLRTRHSDLWPGQFFTAT